ncbi:transposase [Streptomyces sp. NPDC056254]|uniref:transposase n=1 Tax=Streptomyces sp. NPDC056254 TaxID=3345763 RepID=UPI0035D6AB84
MRGPPARQGRAYIGRGGVLPHRHVLPGAAREAPAANTIGAGRPFGLGLRGSPPDAHPLTSVRHPVRWSRPLPSAPSAVTVIKDASGRYFASGEVEPKALPAVDAEVGVDLALTDYAVLSNGQVIDNPRFLRRAERRHRKAQRRLSRRPRDRRTGHGPINVARAHARISDARKDWRHQQVSRLIRDNQAVYSKAWRFPASPAPAWPGPSTTPACSVACWTRRRPEQAARAGRHVGVVSRWLPPPRLGREREETAPCAYLAVRRLRNLK